MLFVDNQRITDPTINLALEEFLLRQGPSEQDLLLFYINEPSIIIGRNQNTIDEINLDYVETHGIHVVRRLSGGGAVYHDLGNLNFSFITRSGKEDAHDFKKFTAPVIQALIEMGAPAQLSGRNDILIEDRKISGNASYLTREGVVSHGTLLFDTDLSRLGEALKVKPGKIASKGIKSVRSRVANIVEYLPASIDMETFRLNLLYSLFEAEAGLQVPEYHLTPSDWQAIETLTQERYRSRAWNFGHMETYNYQRTRRFAFGEIDARFYLEDGEILLARFYGDFFGRENVAELERLLEGVRWEPGPLQIALARAGVAAYFGSPATGFISAEQMVDFLFGPPEQS